MGKDPLEAYESWLNRIHTGLLFNSINRGKSAAEDEKHTGSLGAFETANEYWEKLDARRSPNKLERYITVMERLSRKNGDPTPEERKCKRRAYRLIIHKAKRIQ